MGSFTHLTYHIVFATKYRKPLINDALREPLYEYLGGIIRAKKGSVIEIGGVADHVHLLLRLSPTIAVSDVIRELKANSSKWIDEQRQCSFEWQKGFGAFTVSYDKLPAVAKYIRNQLEHHRTKSFQEEYIEFLHRHEMKFDVAHLFENEQYG
jgi:putative transposase